MRVAKESGYRLFETSAKANTGIEFMFNEIATMLYEDPPKSKRKDTIRIQKPTIAEEEEKSFLKRTFG